MPSLPHSSRRWLPWLLFAFAWLLTAWLRPVALPDEGRYGGVALEMVQSGHWLTPTLFGLPYFHKPPLMYWVDAAAITLLGPVPLALRAAPLLGGLVMGLALWLEARQRAGRAVAADALGWLAALPLGALSAQYANHDLLVAGWITLAIVAMRQALRADARPPAARLRWLLLAWAAAAQGVLSKGLIGLVLPALVLAPWLIVRRRWADLGRALHPLGLALFALIALPWFLAMQQQFPAFFDYFVMEQHVRRYTQTHFNNVQPFWFFFAVLPLATLPASARLWPALKGAVAGLRRPATDAAFDLWWLLAVLLFFSLPRSKLVGYVLPALPPLVLLLREAWAGRRGAALVKAAAAALSLAVAAGFALRGHDHADLGAALREHLQPGDQVVQTGDAFFDLRLQAGLAQSPAVLGDWPALQRSAGDNWQRELMDAARFAPDHGSAVLWTPERLQAERCAGGRFWLVAPDAAQAAAVAPDARPMARAHHGLLLQLPHPVGCPAR
ncbi:MAG: glycosyl transferase [Roseateles depolymerans]|uniref:Glycosyl transferase n=1 Tax=Roseateles depolymerans TaxID=76731 RepID=A0A2W5DW95_9BURK|nr:MAG: glycosyl transferase [Roseateles depolymerans]